MGRRSHLEITLMCLIARAPATGARLVRLLREHPLMGRGQSPGAVYPALRRLREAGLVTSRAKPRREALASFRARTGKYRDGRCARRFRECLLTAEGLEHLKDWAVQPVTRGEILERPDDLLLRFAFLSGLQGPEAVRSFLEGYEARAEELRQELGEFLGEDRGELSTSGRLALELELALVQTRRDWARRAAPEFARG